MINLSCIIQEQLSHCSVHFAGFLDTGIWKDFLGTLVKGTTEVVFIFIPLTDFTSTSSMSTSQRDGVRASPSIFPFAGADEAGLPRNGVPVGTLLPQVRQFLGVLQ